MSVATVRPGCCRRADEGRWRGSPLQSADWRVASTRRARRTSRATAGRAARELLAGRSCAPRGFPRYERGNVAYLSRAQSPPERRHRDAAARDLLEGSRVRGSKGSEVDPVAGPISRSERVAPRAGAREYALPRASVRSRGRGADGRGHDLRDGDGAHADRRRDRGTPSRVHRVSEQGTRGGGHHERERDDLHPLPSIGRARRNLNPTVRAPLTASLERPSREPRGRRGRPVESFADPRKTLRCLRGDVGTIPDSGGGRPRRTLVSFLLKTSMEVSR